MSVDESVNHLRRPRCRVEVSKDDQIEEIKTKKEEPEAIQPKEQDTPNKIDNNQTTTTANTFFSNVQY